MIKAIFFDCFGVLATEGWEPFCYQHFSKKPEQARQAKELARQLNLGQIDYDSFISRVATLAKISEAATRAVIDRNVPNGKLFEYIDSKLKPKYQIGFLSNAGGNWLDELFTPDQIKLFDDVVISSEVGYIKPDAKIYELAAERLGINTKECIFVDDRQQHVDGAINAGMQAILYNNFPQMQQELETILNVKM